MASQGSQSPSRRNHRPGRPSECPQTRRAKLISRIGGLCSAEQGHNGWGRPQRLCGTQGEGQWQVGRNWIPCQHRFTTWSRCAGARRQGRWRRPKLYRPRDKRRAERRGRHNFLAGKQPVPVIRAKQEAVDQNAESGR
jgi:hypothetical protein